MFLFSNDLGVDLGTSNVLIYADGKGLVVREPSVVAMDKNTGKILQVGAAARNMLGRTPGNVVAMHPLKDGTVSDHEMTVRMLQEMFKTATKASFFTPKPRVVISVPSGVSEVEERSVINAAIEAGARRVFLIEEPLAAGLGAGLDIRGPSGHLVVDIGGGTTDIAVLSMNGVAVSSSLKVAATTLMSCLPESGISDLLKRCSGERCWRFMRPALIMIQRLKVRFCFSSRFKTKCIGQRISIRRQKLSTKERMQKRSIWD